MQEEPTPPFAKGGGRRAGGAFPRYPALFGRRNPQSASLTAPFAKGTFSHTRGVPYLLSQKGVAPQGRGIFLFRKTAAPQGWGAFPRCLAPFGRGNPQSAALTAPFAKGAFSHTRGAPYPLSQKGVARRAGGFSPLPCVLRKEKSSVSSADSSFCERSLFSRKRSPQPPFSKGGGP